MPAISSPVSLPEPTCAKWGGMRTSCTSVSAFPPGLHMAPAGVDVDSQVIPEIDHDEDARTRDGVSAHAGGVRGCGWWFA